jgi:hypothetical protein
MAMTDKELLNAWRSGNDSGRGYAVGEEDMSPSDAAKDAGLENIRTISPDGIVVGELAGDVVVVADCNGPWAVTVDRIVEAQSKGIWPEPTEPEPDMDQLEAWACDSVVEATDGCTVEPDGVCPHGHPSWLIKLGVI